MAIGGLPQAAGTGQTQSLLDRYRSKLLVWTCVGVLAGFVVGGFGARPLRPFPIVAEIIGLPGHLFLRALQALVLPLVVTSLVSGVMLVAQSAKGGGRAVVNASLYFALTTSAAVCLGIAVYFTIRPGRAGERREDGDAARAVGRDGGAATAEALIGLAESMVTDNLVGAAAENNILGLIVAATAAALAMTRVSHKVVRPLIDLNAAVYETVMKVLDWVLLLLPMGIGSLIAGRLLEIRVSEQLFLQLAFFCVAVLTSLGIFSLVVLPVLYFLTVRKNPFAFYRSISEVAVVAFSTGSSSATLPVTLRVCKEMGLSEDVVSWLLPLFATINMSGTALYEAMAALFIADVSGVELTAAKVCIIAVTATFAAVGASGVPEAGLITMVIVLEAAGLPLDSIGLILSVDWALDRVRTMTNVLGDCVGSAIVDAQRKA